MLVRSCYVLILLLFTSLLCFAADYDSLRKEYDLINKKGTTRQSWGSLGDKFYKLYLSDPSAKNADFALFYAGKSYKNSYESHNNLTDLESAQKYFRITYTNFNSTAAAESYLESAELFILKRDLASAQYVLNSLKKKYPDTSHELAANSMLADLALMSQMSSRSPSNLDETNAVAVVANTTSNATQSNPPVLVEEIISSYVSDDSGQVNVPEGATLIKNIRYYSGKDYTRIVIDLSQNTPVEQHWLKEDRDANLPSRLFLEIPESVVDVAVPREISIKDGIVKSVRWAYNRPGVPRIVLDSESINDFTVFQMENPPRVVIDVNSGGDKQSRSLASRSSGTQYNSTFSTEPTGGNKTLAEVFGLRVKTIVIDPGHGGKDPGAVYYNIKEKDLVLDIALQLKAMFEKNNKDIKVYLTRETDVFIPLEERTAIANKYKADLFISIHVNAAKNTKARGIETYVLDVTKDRTSLELAAFENQSTTKAISDLQGILKDIMLSSKLEESLNLAASIQNGMVNNLKLTQKENLGVKRAPFYVLVGATMPATLVEIGFLSNKDDSDKLKTAKYRTEAAKGLYLGINEYIKKLNR